MEMHHGPMAIPEEDPGEDPQRLSGHEKMPTADHNSCVVAQNLSPAGAHDYQLPRVLKAEHVPRQPLLPTPLPRYPLPLTF